MAEKWKISTNLQHNICIKKSQHNTCIKKSQIQLQQPKNTGEKNHTPLISKDFLITWNTYIQILKVGTALEITHYNFYGNMNSEIKKCHALWIIPLLRFLSFLKKSEIQRPCTKTVITVKNWKQSKCLAGDSVVKNLPANGGDAGDMGSMPKLGRSPGGENAYPLQYSCLGYPMDRGAWWDAVHGVAKNWMWLSN